MLRAHGNEQVDLLFTDPPYNVKIDGNVCGLGETGRYRTNVSDYAGISSISASRGDELAMLPTVKPVAMIADAIKDRSRRGGIILDCFGGSGSTLIASEKTGKRRENKAD
jgi:DNA modification methylase